MIDANGRWYPNLSPKQVAVYNDQRRHLLLSGPRICGKSIVAEHKVVKHAWLYDNDRVGIFVKSTKTGKTGVWDDIVSYVLPQWQEGMKDAGFEITFGPAVDGATRMHYVRIRNRHGTESEIQLHPLHHQDSVEEKLKGSRFGCIFFDELDNYDNPEVFNVSVLQLRQIGLPDDRHLWIGTCNPAGDTDHWIYQKFWVDPVNDELDLGYRRTFGTYEFKIADNPFLRPETISLLKMTYKNDPDTYERYVNGLWVPDTKSTFFAGAFTHGHVRGDATTDTIIVPTDKCIEIIVGWDIGDRNHGVSFMEHVQTLDGDYWSILDEITHNDEDYSIEELTYEVMEKMEEIEKIAGKKLTFKHWSDRSAFDRYRSAADAKDHILVNQYSKGRIELIGCPKGPGSVKARIGLVRQLLVEKRLFFSANCMATTDMMRKLSKGKIKSEVIKRDKHIHIFDAMSYALFGELIGEIEDSLRPNLKQQPAGFVLAD